MIFLSLYMYIKNTSNKLLRKRYLDLINTNIRYVLNEDSLFSPIKEKDCLHSLLNSTDIRFLRKNLNEDLGFKLPYHRINNWTTVKDVIDDIILYKIIDKLENHFN